MTTKQDRESAAAALRFGGRAVINGIRTATEKTSVNTVDALGMNISFGDFRQ